jgi:hypothetical protein
MLVLALIAAASGMLVLVMGCRQLAAVRSRCPNCHHRSGIRIGRFSDHPRMYCTICRCEW